jgi:hypothetical protein
MKISDIVEHAKGRRAKIYTKKPINTIEPKKPEAPMNEEDKELGTITAPPGPDGNVQMKTPDGKTTTMPAKDMVAKDDTTQQVPATPGSDLVGDKVVQTSEDYEEDEHEHPSHAHFHDWMNSEHAPHDDDSGDHDMVFNKALHFLSDKVHPGDIENYAHHLTHKFHGGGIDEESSVYPSRNDPALAAQAAATQPGHQSVMPSRNAPTKENHGEIGRDAGDAYIADILAQPEDKLGHAHVNERDNTFGAKSELEHMLRIAGLR